LREIRAMRRPSPEVLDGMRTPRAALQEQGVKVGLYARFKAAAADRHAKAKAERSANVKDIVFSSRYTNHRIQLTAPRDVILQDGTKVQGRPLVAQFKDSTYKVPRHIDDKDAEVIVAKLRAHPAYGIGKDFWEREDALDEGKIRQMAQVTQMLEADPVVKEGVLDFITAQEFERVADEDQAKPAGRPRLTATEEEEADEEDTAPRKPEAPVDLSVDDPASRSDGNGVDDGGANKPKRRKGR